MKMGVTSTDSTVVKLANLLKPAWQGQDAARPDLAQVIERVRQRWRLRLLLNGLFWTLTSMLLLVMVCAWLINHWHFAGGLVALSRFIIIFALSGLLWQFGLKPLTRRVSDTRVALYLQEHELSLKSIILSAVDARQTSVEDVSPQLNKRLLEQALDASAEVGFGQAVEQAKLQQVASKLGLVVLAIVLLAIAPPEFLRNSAKALLIPWTNASEYSPYHIELAPGNIEIARGADQLISANIDGFDGDDVLLMTSVDGGISWRQTPMEMVSDAGLYESFLFDLKQPLVYYVSAAGRQTETYGIDVIDIPVIEDISLHYHFPAYTMLPAETSHGSGDISALRGTRVEVQIKPDIDIPGGTLLLNNGERIELTQSDSQIWRGGIIVEENSSYTIELQAASGAPVEASAEYRITALNDQSPGIAILSPGRDMKVSMIEEPVMKFRASDDQGIANLELVLSVNGGSQQRIKLMPGDEQPGVNRQFDAEHILYLEDLDLKPGDLISYYVQTEDLAPENQSRSATSDIFFYQIRPFSNNYRSGEQGGGGGGAQGGQQHGHLADQQKQFVIAIFKMIRDRDQYDADTYRDNLEILAEAQSRIRGRVEAIVRRLGTRSIVQVDERYRVIIKELPLAAEAMVEVEEKLKEIEIESALTDAQLALLHLQRADAAFRDINVSMANRSGGGAGSNAGFEEIADLFRLEMDKLRNQYETVQSGQSQSPDEAIDETLQRLRELAKRQQKEVERQLRLQDQAGNANNARQLALAEELEAMARQLERLSREQPNPQLNQSIQQMRDAAEAMRQAAASAGAGGSAGVDQARQAMTKLQQAQSLLDQSRQRQFSDAVERSLRRAELAEKRQAAIKQEVEQVDEQWSKKLIAQLRQLDVHKSALSEELLKLESELSELTTSAREQQPQVSRSLKQAIRASRDYRLQDRIGRTFDMVQLGQKESAIENETEIENGISKIRENIETALASVDGQNTGGLETSLERMLALARELKLAQERASSSSTTQGSGGDIDQRTGRLLEGLAARADAIGRVLLDQGVASGDINPVLERINQLTQAGSGESSAYSELSEQALYALMELEYRLRRQMQEAETSELLITESADVPDDYRALVADYFRGLSRQ
jgi:hypothetical protein